MLPKASQRESFPDGYSDQNTQTARNTSTGRGSKRSETVTGAFVSSSPQLVIECPSCQTRFAVDSDAVASVESPRFHCSRCDAVFALDAAHVSHAFAEAHRENQLPHSHPQGSGQFNEVPRAHVEIPSPWERQVRALPEFPPASSSVPVEFAPTQDVGARSPEQQPAPSAAQVADKLPPRQLSSIPAPIRPSDFSIGRTSADSTTQSSAAHTSPAPIRTFAGEGAVIDDMWPSQAAPLQDQPPAAPPVRAQNQQPPPKSLLSVDFDQPELSQGDAQAEFSELSPEVSLAGPNASGAALKHNLTSTAPRTEPYSAKSSFVGALMGNKEESLVAPRPRPTTLDQDAPLAGRRDVRRVSRTQSLVALSIPLVAGLAGLVMLSYSMRASPQGVGGVVASLVPGLRASTPQLPPAELAISKVSLRFVQLATKEVLPVVTGTLVNRSQQPVDGVQLQALGFDSRGEIILSSQAPLRSALSREKVAELDLANVKKFQLSLSARKAAINPGEEVSFSIALLGNDTREDGQLFSDVNLASLKYFSARVFSVRGK